MSNEDKKLNLDDLNMSGGAGNEPNIEKNDFNIGPPPPPPPFHHFGGKHRGGHPRHPHHGNGWHGSSGEVETSQIKNDVNDVEKTSDVQT